MLLLRVFLVALFLPGFGRGEENEMVGIVSSEAASPISLRVSQAGHVVQDLEQRLPTLPNKASPALGGVFDVRAAMQDALKQAKLKESSEVKPEVLIRQEPVSETPSDSSSFSWIMKFFVAAMVYLCYKHKYSSKPGVTGMTVRGTVVVLAAWLRKLDPVRFYVKRHRERPSFLVRPNGQEINTLPEALGRLRELVREWRSPQPVKAPIPADGVQDDFTLQPSMVRALAGFEDQDLEGFEQDTLNKQAQNPFLEHAQNPFLERSQNLNPFLEQNEPSFQNAFQNAFPDLLEPCFVPFPERNQRMGMPRPLIYEYEQETHFPEYEPEDLL